jgi:hypothetical protein
MDRERNSLKPGWQAVVDHIGNEHGDTVLVKPRKACRVKTGKCLGGDLRVPCGLAALATSADKEEIA